MSTGIQSKKEFMDELTELMAYREEASYSEIDNRGRPRQLKTYIIESNSQLPTSFHIDDLLGVIKTSGVPYIHSYG